MKSPHGGARAERDLEAILAEIRACRICRDAPRGRPLPHEPRPVVRARASARIAICGQAPGTRVHASGVPFSDPSGVRLRGWLGVKEAEFYDEARVAIAPMGFCFPGLTAGGADLPPRRECAPAWRAALFSHLPDLELVVAVGRPAQLWHLGGDAAPNLTETVAAWRGVLERPGSPTVFPLPHPSWRNNAWLKRNAWFETEAVPELRRMIRRLLDGES
ncbi:MAG: uracil-DNA glycosylase [Ancylobacter novellus]|uniref:Uracil-DNA glycosylase n=1 Tax=Ancylobacter novellus TaxID=921 RepID=A0A2W5MDH7_ANCNO|nr:MAG: uracil-DNA glycosylase [Ancylobacter novellus]